MRNIAVFALLGASFLLAPAAPADAQALRTWVSATGNDDNPCTVTAPCKTFALAYSRTATGGEINCLDPGGFGTLGIARSMTIDYLNTQGAILANNVNGISVHGAGVVVHLRGLSISGAGTGLVGVTFTQARAPLHRQMQDLRFPGRHRARGQIRPEHRQRAGLRSCVAG